MSKPLKAHQPQWPADRNRVASLLLVDSLTTCPRPIYWLVLSYGERKTTNKDYFDEYFDQTVSIFYLFSGNFFVKFCVQGNSLTLFWYCKDTEPLYHSFMYSLLSLLSGIYVTEWPTSAPKLLSSVWNWIRDFSLREMIYFWWKLEVAVL